MNFKSEILSTTQCAVLTQLGPVAAELGFYMAGGTALALYFGHRESIDFDFFSAEPIGDPLLLAERLRERQIAFQTEQATKGTLHGQIRQIRVTFLEYCYPLLQPVVNWPEYGCNIAALDDLVCMKLSAAAQRGARKDFLDIYTLGLRHRPLAEMLALYRKKYSVTDIAHVVYSLSYFEDAEKEPVPALYHGQTWPDVKLTLQSWVKTLPVTF